MTVELLLKVAKEQHNGALAGASAAVGAAGAAAYTKAHNDINAAKERYVKAKAKGHEYNKKFIRNGGTSKGVKNPFAATVRLMNHNAKAEALKKAYGAGGIARKVATGGKIAAGLGAAGVLAAGARQLLSKKEG